MGSESQQLRLWTIAIRTGVRLVNAAGALERATVSELERELAAVPIAADVIVDLDEAEIGDAAPLGVLRLRAARLRERGNELTVVCERDPGARTLLRREGVSVSASHDGASTARSSRRCDWPTRSRTA